MHRAILYEFPGADAASDRFIHKTATDEVTIVLVGDPIEIPSTAQQLSRAGAGLVELCGGVPLAIRAKVKAAVGPTTRVAAVSFGIESIVKAAAFNQAFMEGKPPAEACIVLTRDADPATDRFVRRSGSHSTTFVMSDESAAPQAARLLAEHGVGLIELYGGFSDLVASEVVEAVAGRCAVGVSGFGHELPAEPVADSAMAKHVMEKVP